MQANARLTPNESSKEKEKRRSFISEFLRRQADKGNIPKVPNTYDDRTGQFVSPELPPPYEEDPLQTPEGDEPKINEDLREALLRCENLGILNRVDIDVNNCSWKEVFAQMSKANIDYQKQAEGFRNSRNRLWRAMGKRADDAKPWIELIPSDFGLDSLKAGLALCFSVRIEGTRPPIHSPQPNKELACAERFREEHKNSECV